MSDEYEHTDPDDLAALPPDSMKDAPHPIATLARAEQQMLDQRLAHIAELRPLAEAQFTGDRVLWGDDVDRFRDLWAQEAAWQQFEPSAWWNPTEPGAA